MRVELHIDGNLAEPHARICAQKITPALQAAIELLEREGERAWLMGQKAGKHFVLDPGQVEILRTEGREPGAVRRERRAIYRFQATL